MHCVDYDVSDLTAINTLDPETRNGFPLALHDKNGNTIYLGLIIRYALLFYYIFTLKKIHSRFSNILTFII